MTSSSVDNQVKSAISESQEFAAIKDTKSFDIQVATGTEAAAQAAIGQADAMSQMLQMQRDETNQKIISPPMKDVPIGGESGGMKQVVDNEELAKFQAKLAALDSQLTDAKAKADNARTEATEATGNRIQATSESNDAAGKEDEALSRASTLRTALAGSERQDLNELSKGLSDKELLTEYDKIVAQQTTTTTKTADNEKNTKEVASEAGTEKRVAATTASTSSNTD